jgi:two-component system, response regulator PdtaR
MDSNEMGTILVVDDDRLVLATLTHGLSQAGYRVIDADNGDDAILLAREHQPALALLDIRMQGKSGFDVAEYLREYHQIPFIFLSAFSDDATLARGRSLGAAASLTKPLDIGQILPVVEAVLSRTGQADAVAGDTAGDVAHAGPQPAVVWMAIGALMHRHSIDRNAALQRLRQLALSEKRPLLEQAERVLEAVEALGLPGAPSGEPR